MENKVKIRLKVGFQYLGPENGSLPHLDVYYVMPDGSEFYCVEAVSFLPESEVKKIVDLSNSFEKYEKNGINVGHAMTKDIWYISRMGVDFRQVKNDSYQNALKIFADFVASVYFDYNGRRIGFTTMDSPLANMVEIVIDGKKLNLANNRDTDFSRQILSDEILKNLGYIVASFNAKKVNNITDHTSPRK